MSRRSCTVSSGREPTGDLDDRLLAHAEDHQVGLGVEQDRAADGVAPVIVMGQAPQRGLDAAGDDRHAGKRLAGALAVGESGAVGPQADPAAGAVGVVVADLLVGRVVVDHAVHVAGADAEEQPRPAELPPGLGAAPVGLAQDRHAKPGRLEHAAQDAHGECRMIDVGVAGDEDDVDLVPAPRVHLGTRCRQRAAASPEPSAAPASCVGAALASAARRAGGWSSRFKCHRDQSTTLKGKSGQNLRQEYYGAVVNGDTRPGMADKGSHRLSPAARPPPRADFFAEVLIASGRRRE